MTVKGKQYAIAQCNNSYIFPGIGLGVIAAGASRVTDEMLMAASETLANHSPLVNNGEGPVLPELKDIQAVSRAIAFAVGKVAQEQGRGGEKHRPKRCCRPLAIISGSRNIATIAEPQFNAFISTGPEIGPVFLSPPLAVIHSPLFTKHLPILTRRFTDALFHSLAGR